MLTRPSMSEYLVKEYGETDTNSSRFEKIANEHLFELGSYITSMRELKNIVNEFLQYNEQLGGKLEGHKLLAITIYKNNYPQDYAALHDKNGVLYRALQSKTSFADAANAEYVSELTKLEESNKTYRDQLEKYRTQHIDKLKNRYDFEGVVVDGKEYTNKQIITNDRIFNLLANDRISSYIKTDGEDLLIENYDKLFSNIADEVNPDFTYFEAVSETEGNLEYLSSKIDFLYREIDIKKRSSLSVIIKSIKNGNDALEIIKNVYNEGKKQQKGGINTVDMRMCEMILYLLRNGYIDELFSHYISFSHSDEKDDTFIKNIKLSIQNKYDYTLTDATEVLKKLPIDYYDSNVVLNYDLLDCILSGVEENEAILDKVISVVKNGELEFIVGYERIGENAKRFFEILLSKWSEYLDVTFDQNSNEKHDELLIIFFKYCTTPNVFNDSRGKLSDSYKFIIDNLGRFEYTLVTDIITKLKITFNNLIKKEIDGTQRLFDFVINNRYFVINASNLKTIIGDDFTSKSFTSVINFGNNNVINYLKTDIELLGSLFAETSVEESKEAIIELLNNDKLSKEFKIDYIKKQLIIIDSVTGVSAENERILFITDHIEPNWSNIINHFINSGNKLDETLSSYIERNVYKLKEIVSIDGESNKSIDELFVALFSDNNLSFEVYSSLVPQFGTKISDINTSIESQRLKVLIGNNSIEYNEGNIATINQNFSSEIFGDFLTNNFDAYIDDVENEITLDNMTALHLLRSTLTIDDKIWLLNNKVSAIADDNQGADLANEICYYYAESGINSDSNVELILIALSRTDDWFVKITIINSINSSLGYQKERVVNMMTALGGGYLKLNSFYGSAIFDSNAENRCLLDFLKSNRHFVKNVAEENGKLKVSFYHK